MRKKETRWRRRRRGYSYLVAAAGLFGLFLMLSGISRSDWSWIFAVLGFASLILCMRKALALWSLDRLVFDRKTFGPTTRLQPAGTARPIPGERLLRESARASRQLRLAQPGPVGPNK